MRREADEPYASVMPYYERLRLGYLQNAQQYEGRERTTRAVQLATLTYEEVLKERVVFGTPQKVKTGPLVLGGSLKIAFTVALHPTGAYNPIG